MSAYWDSDWPAKAISYFLMIERNSQMGVLVHEISLLAEPNGNLVEGVVSAFIS